MTRVDVENPVFQTESRLWTSSPLNNSIWKSAPRVRKSETPWHKQSNARRAVWAINRWCRYERYEADAELLLTALWCNGKPRGSINYARRDITGEWEDFLPAMRPWGLEAVSTWPRKHPPTYIVVHLRLSIFRWVMQYPSVDTYACCHYFMRYTQLTMIETIWPHSSAKSSSLSVSIRLWCGRIWFGTWVVR